MKSFLHHLYHYGAYLLGAVVIVVSVVALILRFVVMPDIDRYKASIEAGASRAVGIPVRIADIQADWWHINPRFSLRDVTLAAADRPAALTLSRVDATLSWFSLGLLEPHLARLDVYQPSLEIRRDGKGMIFVAGIPVNGPGASSPFPDWLLRQRVITVSGGRLTWIDESLGAPPLVMEEVNLLIRNLFGRHRFGLTAAPPTEAGQSLDLRGDFKGASVHQSKTWSGQLYLAAAGASAAALNTWSPWAQSAVRRSTGDLRFWMNVDKGQVRGVVGDVSLSHVAVSLANDLPDMAFSRVSGRLGWRRTGLDHVYQVEKLRFTTVDGRPSDPSDVQVTVRPREQGGVETAHVVADNLRLEALTALSGSLPLPRQAHDWIGRINPRGFIERIEFNWLGKERFLARARFREGGMNATDKLPGFTGLSGEIEADERGGKAVLTSRNLNFVLDKVFRQPLDFSRLDSRLNWTQIGRDGYRITLEQCILGNADLDGHAEGSVLWQPGRAPVMDLTAQLTRGNGSAVWRYLPITLSQATHDWVKRGVVAGISPDTRLVLRGPLDRFPFDRGGGEFFVDIQMRDASLDYAPDWPRITGVNGLLTFKGKGMLIATETGEISGARLGKVRAIIPDLHGSDLETLTLDGQASGPTSAFLDFIHSSPVNEHTGGFTEKLRADGNTELNLQLRLPLRHMHDSQVAGKITLADNRIDLGGRLPTLENVTGTLAFTESWVRGSKVAAKLRGQPVSLDLASETGGRVRANLNGALTAATLAQWLPPALATRISGSAKVAATVNLRAHEMAFEVNSNLDGLAINLPQPLGKKADQVVAVNLSGRDTGNPPVNLGFRYGNLLSGALSVPEQGDAGIGLMFGGQPAPLLKQSGLVVQGNLRQFDLDAWRDLGLSSGTGKGPPIRNISLSFNELKAFNRLLRDIHVQVRPNGPTWQVKLAGQDIQGEAEYGPRQGQPGQRFSGRFAKLAIPAPGSQPAALAIAEDELTEWPAEVELTAKAFSFHGRELGQLGLDLSVEKSGLRINTLKLANPDSELGGGGWLSASPLRETQLDLKLTSGNLGALMRRLGYIEAVKGGELAAEGRIAWMGRPDDFALARLSGHLATQIKNGRFTQLDPGAAKLLGILSLQALPRRIALDFRDVFSEGFAFDEIKGDVHIDRGIAYLPGLDINGPAAKVRMNGKIDLDRENQELRLYIQPRLDEGVAVAGALIGGPAVGIGTWLASKLLKDPIAKAASFEYLVSGTWSDPKVKKLPRPTTAQAETSP